MGDEKARPEGGKGNKGNECLLRLEPVRPLGAELVLELGATSSLVSACGNIGRRAVQAHACYRVRSTARLYGVRTTEYAPAV